MRSPVRIRVAAPDNPEEKSSGLWLFYSPLLTNAGLVLFKGVVRSCYSRFAPSSVQSTESGPHTPTEDLKAGFQGEGRGYLCQRQIPGAEKKTGGASRILPFGQYTHTLRLKSKLFDLRVEYANLSCFARQGRGLQCFANKKRSTARADLFLLVEHQGLEPWTDRL